jgi:hypothetical protein
MFSDNKWEIFHLGNETAVASRAEGARDHAGMLLLFLLLLLLLLLPLLLLLLLLF